jgi:hypothetical protein
VLSRDNPRGTSSRRAHPSAAVLSARRARSWPDGPWKAVNVELRRYSSWAATRAEPPRRLGAGGGGARRRPGGERRGRPPGGERRGRRPGAGMGRGRARRPSRSEPLRETLSRSPAPVATTVSSFPTTAKDYRGGTRRASDAPGSPAATCGTSVAVPVIAIACPACPNGQPAADRRRRWEGSQAARSPEDCAPRTRAGRSRARTGDRLTGPSESRSGSPHSTVRASKRVASGRRYAGRSAGARTELSSGCYERSRRCTPPVMGGCQRVISKKHSALVMSIWATGEAGSG